MAAKERFTLNSQTIWQPDKDLGYSLETTYTKDSTLVPRWDWAFYAYVYSGAVCLYGIQCSRCRSHKDPADYRKGKIIYPACIQSLLRRVEECTFLRWKGKPIHWDFIGGSENNKQSDI